jgi:3D-(3,5/4)-trihydroxycyclohexane-1,2-dione acylhydrolase (decyclizing)
VKTTRFTMGQAIVEFLVRQHVARDGVEQRFFAGVLGIFGHGNVAGLGEGLLAARDRLRYVLVRNEQAMVHTAVAYAKRLNRLGAWACTTSIGPGATNMTTGAATATINRIPVLLLPGDIFASRRPGAVLQQLESAASQDVSVNDCLRPVSRYWDRINRPDQLVVALLEAMRVLTSPAETGAVTLAIPQDVQAEAFDYPGELFERRVWTIPRTRPDKALVAAAAELVRGARRPLVIAGGGVLYSDATDSLRRFAESTGIGVAETQAGKGSLPFDHPQYLGAVGVTGGLAANRVAREADVLVVVGSRLSDFTTASRTAFQHPSLRVIAINVAELDAHKAGALPLVGDARATLDELLEQLEGYRSPAAYRDEVSRLRDEWAAEIDRMIAPRGAATPSQHEVLGLLNRFLAPTDVIVCAAGSLPGDLHRYWRARRPNSYHLEYGYSCMGYEVAGGLGVKMADPAHEVYVLVGDGSYLMMAQEIVTAVQEGLALTIVLLDNSGFGSIGGLSEAVGCGGFGTEYRRRGAATGLLDGEVIDVDFAANAASLGATSTVARSADALLAALEAARATPGVKVIVVPVDRAARSPGYDAWWDVPVAEVSTRPEVREARERYEKERQRVRCLI